MIRFLASCENMFLLKQRATYYYDMMCYAGRLAREGGVVFLLRKVVSRLNRLRLSGKPAVQEIPFSEVRSLSRNKTLPAKNLPLIHRRDPGHRADVARFVRHDPARPIRQWVGLVLSTRKAARKRTLIVDHQLGGGAGYYRQNLMAARKGPDEAFLVMTHEYKKGGYRIECGYDHLAPIAVYLPDTGSLPELLALLQVHEIIINNLFSYPDPLGVLDQLRLFKRHQGARLICCVHDYFMVCPSLNLLDKTGTYCNLPDVKVCPACIRENPYRGGYPRVVDLGRWRRSWQWFLNDCDEILCFSESSRQILRKVYPLIDLNRFTLRPHRVEGLRKVSGKGQKKKGLRTIGVIGVMAVHKGRRIVLEMNKAIAARKLDLRIVVIGEFPDDVIPVPMGGKPGSLSGMIVTGRYRREQLPDLIEAYGVDLALVPSVCPETFSYVTEECMQMGVPVAVFDLGAPAERVRNYEQGLVIEKIDADTALDRIADYLGLRR